MRESDFHPDKYHIGVDPNTLDVLNKHPVGKTLHKPHHEFQGGHYISVTREEYARIATFCAEGETIEQAVRKAFA